MSVAGPTLGWTFDFISFEPNDTAGELFQRTAASQKSDAEHCHAPWDSVINDLGPDRGTIIHEFASRQVTTWDPSTQRRAQAKQQQHKRFLELQSMVFFLLEYRA
jgi:hypothetical protein